MSSQRAKKQEHQHRVRFVLPEDEVPASKEEGFSPYIHRKIKLVSVRLLVCVCFDVLMFTFQAQMKCANAVDPSHVHCPQHCTGCSTKALPGLSTAHVVICADAKQQEPLIYELICIHERLERQLMVSINVS